MVKFAVSFSIFFPHLSLLAQTSVFWPMLLVRKVTGLGMRSPAFRHWRMPILSSYGTKHRCLEIQGKMVVEDIEGAEGGVEDEVAVEIYHWEGQMEATNGRE